MIDLHLLEHLYAFYEHKTLSSAAENLHLSQPSLSRSMQRLEEVLEVKLFERRKNRIILNENGILAAEYAKQILDKEREMFEKLRAFDMQNHSISIGSCAPGPLILLSPLIEELFPNSSISSVIKSEKDLIEGLKNYKFSFIVLSHPIKEEGIYCTKYTNEQLYINLPPGHPMVDFDTITFNDMDGQSFIMYEQVGVWNDIIQNEMPNSRFFMQNNMDAVGEIANVSDLPSFSSDITQKHLPSRKNKRINIPLSDPAANITFYLACLKSYHRKLLPLFKSIA